MYIEKPENRGKKKISTTNGFIIIIIIIKTLMLLLTYPYRVHREKVLYIHRRLAGGEERI